MSQLIDLKRRVGENARRLRRAEGLTTAKAAEKLHVDDRYLRRLEAGGFNLGLSTLLKLSKLYAVDPSMLVMPLPTPAKPRRAGRPKTK